ncbi:MAG: lecithin retinol acyltransferase family protein [Planctomycetota bacterium]
MARGDHFFVWRQHHGVPFQHHGIDAGDGTVIHFTDGEDGVAGPGGSREEMVIARTTRELVTRNGRDVLHVIEHDQRLSVEDSIQRAESQIGRQGYHLVFDNCEHFASWCVVGDDESRQITVACERLGSVGVKVTARLAAKCAGRWTLRGATPWMYLSDAAQWLTEAGGHHVGLRDPSQRRRVGQAVGATTAIGLGAASGPVGMAVAGGMWVAGQWGGDVGKSTYSRLRRQRSRSE